MSWCKNVDQEVVEGALECAQGESVWCQLLTTLVLVLYVISELWKEADKLSNECINFLLILFWEGIGKTFY